MLLKMWRQEFSVEKFKLQYYPAEDFAICWFQKTERVLPVWIAYRAILFLYFLVTFLYAALPYGKNIAEEDKSKFFIFLTHWTYTIECLQFGLAFIIAVIRFSAERKNSGQLPMDKIPWYYQMYWIFFTVSVPCAVVVSVIFWASVYDPVLFPADFLNIILHAMNSFFMLLDFALVKHPVRMLHFYWPALYGLVYAVFSVIYHLCGGTGIKGLIPIYNILDWREPGKAVLTCLTCLVFVLVLHFLFALLSLCKIWMKKSGASE